MEPLFLFALVLLACWCTHLNNKINRISNIQTEFLNAQTVYNDAMVKSMEECIEHSKSMDKTFQNFTTLLQNIQGGSQDD